MVTSASYPANFASFGLDEVDNLDTVFANHVNLLRAEIAAMQRTMGVNPQASSDTVSGRIAAVDSSTVHITGAETVIGAKSFNGGLSATSVHIPAPEPTTSAAQSSLQLGLITGPNLAVGNSGLNARNNGSPATLALNPGGGLVTTAGQLNVGTSGTAELLAGDITVNKVRINTNSDASLGGTNHPLQVGATGGSHLVIDGNEIQGRAAGGSTPSQIWLNNEGAPVQVGGTFIVAAGAAGKQALFRVPTAGGLVVSNDLCDMLSIGYTGTVTVNGLVVNPLSQGVLSGVPARIALAPNGNGGVISNSGFGDSALQFAANEVSITNGAMNAFRTCRASAFTVSSSVAVKKKIRPLPFSALDVVTSAPSKLWRYRSDHAEDSIEHVGPMAEDLPAELVRDGDSPAVDIMSLVGTLWAAVAELSGKLDALTSRTSEPEPA